MTRSRIAVVAAIAALVAAFFALNLGQYLDLAYFKAQQAHIDAFFHGHPFGTAAAFFLLYVTVTGLSLPSATLLTLVAGAIFGLPLGTVIVSFASAIGATLAFLAARFVLRDTVQKKFGRRLAAIDRGIEKDGAFYLFTVRLIPIFPFFVVNLVMGLTRIRTATFYLVSQVGMLPGTLVFVNAGTQVAQIDSLAGVLSPGLIGSFVLLGLFPLIARKAVAFIQARRVLRGYARPRRFDRNLVVIGAGSGGLVAAYIAATLRAKVTLIEKDRMGGDCLNTGCVPSKALIRSARVAALMRRAPELGLRAERVEVDFARVMERVQDVIRRIEPHDSVQRFTELGVDVVRGEARITSPYTVCVNGREISTRAIVIAAGARPLVPPIPGLDQIDYLTSDTVWSLREQPRHLTVLGGGTVGCELAQAFARLGACVTQVEMAPRLLVREDPEIAETVAARLREDGVDVRTGHKAKAVRVEDDGRRVLVCEHGGEDVEIELDRILVAVGRKPNTQGYGLEELGIPLAPDRTLEVNEFLQTRVPSIFACGDVAGPFQFTHTASHQAWYATVNALFGGLRKFKADYSVIPRVTFTDPEVAHVGLNESEARRQTIAYELTTYDIGELDRAITEGEAHGMVKVLTVPGKDKILGATVMGENAGELIAEYVTAMRHGLGLNKILGTIHAYPTLVEANRYAAGEWKRAHAPETALRWIARFHAWRRGGRRRPQAPAREP